MDEKQREEIANFRYGLIAPVIARKLGPGERYRLLEEIASQEYHIPYSDKTKVSLRSLERYLAAYERGGWEALKPQPREDKGSVRAIPPEVLARAIELKKEVPSRSIETIIAMLEMSGTVPAGLIRPSTLSWHLKRAGVTRENLTQKKTSWRRYEKSFANELWQGDVHLTLYLPDPRQPEKRKKQVYLIAFIDDYSRLITHAQFYFEENRPKLEDALKKAIIKCGIPHTLYVDNGAIYSSHYLEKICAKLGIELVHSRPYRPQGRGKIEKFFGYVEKSFKPEAYELLNRGQLTTLIQLNEFFWAWLEVAYQRRKHGSTEQAPRIRFAKSPGEIRRIDPVTCSEIFLWEEERKADKTACISLYDNLYEVDTGLAGQKVLLRYDPYDLSVIQVFCQGKRYPDAQPLDLQRHRHAQVTGEEETVPPSGLNYLELAQMAYQELKEKELGRTSLAAYQRGENHEA